MKKIIITGNSIAGVRAAEEIRKKDRDSEITIFCEEPFSPVRRDLFAGFLSKELNEQGLQYHPSAFYKDQQISLVTEKKIVKFNFNRKYLTTDNKEKVDYDVLIITDTSDTRLPDVKGNNKTGVFGVRKMEDAANIQKHFAFVETATVVTKNIEGLKVACALRKRGKETILVIPEDATFSDLLDEETKTLWLRLLEASGIKILSQTTIDEILGEGDVKAVRMNSGKVFACEMVLFADSGPSFKKLLDSEMEIDQAICVDKNFRTNIDGVFAAGDVCEPRRYLNFDCIDLEEQGRVIGVNITGEQPVYNPPLLICSLLIGENSIHLIGSKEDGATERVQQDPETNSHSKVFMAGHRITGAVLINADSEKEKILGWIREKADVSGLQDSLLNELAPLPVDSSASATTLPDTLPEQLGGFDEAASQASQDDISNNS